MKLAAFVSSLALASSCIACASSGNVPKAGAVVPGNGTAALPGDPRCAAVEAYVAKWTEKLRLQDWMVYVACADIPESHGAWAESVVRSVRREMFTTVDPDAPDLELTVAHELTHAILTSVRDADSELVEEWWARTLSELMICREPEDNGQ